jgi:hypothetical protein
MSTTSYFDNTYGKPRFEGMRKGLLEEQTLVRVLMESYPRSDIKLNPKSGYGMDSFDVELFIKSCNRLLIFDVSILSKKNDKYLYLNISKKKRERYAKVARNRRAQVYFAFRIPGDYSPRFQFISYKKVFSLTDKGSIPVTVLLPLSTSYINVAISNYFDER